MSSNKNILECYSNGVRFENPFLVGSGPPSTNAKVIARSFDAGWGGSVLKTMSLDSTQVRNISPRYGRFKDENGKCIGFTNNELITDIPFEEWEVMIRDLKKAYPDKVLVASIMEVAAPLKLATGVNVPRKSLNSPTPFPTNASIKMVSPPELVGRLKSRVTDGCATCPVMSNSKYEWSV